MYYILYVSFEYEYIALIILFLLYFVQVKLIFRQSYTIILFRTFTMTLHVIAMRMVVIGSLALIYDTPIYILARDQEFRIIASTIFFFIALPYVFIVKTIFDRIDFVSVLKSGKSLIFSLYLLTAIFIYCLFTVYSLYPVTYPDVKTIYIIIKTGFCSLVSFFICFTYEYIFTKLAKHQNTYQVLSEALEQGKIDLEKLNQEATIDAFTGLNVRDVAYTRLEHFLSDEEPFYVFFLDMNGLKTVNDSYGHHEGDFYILKTAEILKENFKRDTIARLGGDEFFIVGKFQENNDPCEKIEKTLQEVAHISEKYNKEYETSLSYGYLVIDSSNNKILTSPDAIIKLADQRMYEYKKEIKKQRIVIVPKNL